MAKRGGYLGGSTVVGPASDWFGKGRGVKPWTGQEPQPKKEKSPLNSEERRRLDAHIANQKPEKILERREKHLAKRADDPDRNEKAGRVAEALGRRMKGVVIEMRKVRKPRNPRS